MAKIKKTRFVILGFLLNGTQSGYEIGKMIAQSTSNFWQESDASIYPTLRKLKEEGLVTSEMATSGKRKKELFSITDEGRRAFLHWFSQKPERDLHREEFLLKLFFSGKETEETMKKHIAARLEELRNVEENYKKIETFLKEELPEKQAWLKTVQLGLRHVEVDIAFLTNYGDIHNANTQ